MEAEKDSKVRLTPEMGAMVDALIPQVERHPELYARMEYGGKITRSAVIRDLIRRGLPSLQSQLREVVPPPEKPTPKPTPKTARKPAKKTGRRRK